MIGRAEDKELRDKHKLTDYFGEIENYGDTVQIIQEPVITVQPYARGTVVTPQDLIDQEVTLTVDHANSFAF